jgi:hypothetical protein
METILKWCGLAIGLALVASAPGCGSSTDRIRVGGRILERGAAFACPPDRTLGLTLIAMDVKDGPGKGVAAGEPYPAAVDPTDATFVVPGPDGSGIPPGRYRVALILKPTPAAVLAAEKEKKAAKKKTIRRDTDFFRGRFGAANSPIVRDLRTSGDLIIDLDHPTQEQVGDAG